jgi:TRAP-type C4-dicarboxylate transport system permease small subunit
MKGVFCLQIISAADKAVSGFCKIALLVCACIMIVSAFLQVFFRTFIGNPLSWTDELCRYSMVWLAFIGSGYAIKLRSHIAIDILKEFISERTKTVIGKFNTVATILFALVMIFFGVILSSNNMGQITPGLKLPMGLVYLAIPVGGLIIVFYALLELFGFSGKEGEKE